MKKMLISGWGRNKFITANVVYFNKKNFYKTFGFITRGAGNSYGDTSLNKKIILNLNKKKILFFDKKNGLITVEPGISIGELIEETIKENWMPKVIPGASKITMAGAIANDVHGKNHFSSGSFSKYVEEFSILTENFGLIKCKKKNSELFKLTCGGIGLSGILTSITISLKKIKSVFLLNKTIKCQSIEKMISIFNKFKKYDYLVAWYDFFSKKDKFIISIANHTEKKLTNFKEQKPLKIYLSSFFLNQLTIKIFNFFYYLFNKNDSKIIHYKKFFFPLDRFLDWNKLYGKQGFYQYQFVIPDKNSKNNLKKIIKIIKKSKTKPYLAVIKKMGNNNSNYLSFPIKGYSFALDFKNDNNIIKLLNKLDEIIIKMKGRIYLAKDSTITNSNFFKMYPKANKFKKLLLKYNTKGKISSFQSIRIGIT